LSIGYAFDTYLLVHLVIWNNHDKEGGIECLKMRVHWIKSVLYIILKNIIKINNYCTKLKKKKSTSLIRKIRASYWTIEEIYYKKKKT
jgi:hypothetical protein